MCIYVYIYVYIYICIYICIYMYMYVRNLFLIMFFIYIKMSKDSSLDITRKKEKIKKSLVECIKTLLKK